MLGVGLRCVGFRVLGLGFRVQGLGDISGPGVEIWCFVHRIWYLICNVGGPVDLEAGLELPGERLELPDLLLLGVDRLQLALLYARGWGLGVTGAPRS